MALCISLKILHHEETKLFYLHGFFHQNLTKNPISVKSLVWDFFFFFNKCTVSERLQDTMTTYSPESPSVSMKQSALFHPIQFLLSLFSFLVMTAQRVWKTYGLSAANLISFCYGCHYSNWALVLMSVLRLLLYMCVCMSVSCTLAKSSLTG